MKDQHSNSDDQVRATPESEDVNYGFADYGTPSEFSEYWARFLEELGEDDYEGPHLISVDELRAAGALEVPPSWRKSLGGGKARDLFSESNGDEENPEKQQPARVEPDLAEEVRRS